ncbi:hypothetical protein [Nonomuraea terrae]|uniref:hypothetical protein n=1 Tax=Nonomuraea terrae TaxID=2530383 RepID=UPI0014049445|nr:hypothetical protein [Nonomuraea terrae]
MAVLIPAPRTAGVGHGLAFLGGLTAVDQAAPADRRAGVLSGFYMIVYLEAGALVIGVGLLTTMTGLLAAVQSVTCAVAVLCLVALLIRTRVRAQGETMNTTALRTAYDGLLAVAEAIGAAPLTADVRSAVDWTLSHVALSDRLLAAAARDVLSGRPAPWSRRCPTRPRPRPYGSAWWVATAGRTRTSGSRGAS